jgi:hypothetical protein
LPPRAIWYYSERTVSKVSTFASISGVRSWCRQARYPRLPLPDLSNATKLTHTGIPEQVRELRLIDIERRLLSGVDGLTTLRIVRAPIDVERNARMIDRHGIRSAIKWFESRRCCLGAV